MRFEHDDPELTAAILARTSGPVCGAARDQLCGVADGTLDSIDAELVGRHLEGCAECAALAEALASMRRELPRLFGDHPDPAFLQEVLDRTTARNRTPRLAERCRAAARRLLDRPRIALEGAFVGAVLLVLPVGASRHSSLDAFRHASHATSASVGKWVRATRGTFFQAGASGEPSKEKSR
ncbi:MAG TPA: zf-HC2 domain-containing protein [Candidatus Polarisedimenticolaceae bacterium]|nr:zf-HC2 domain-containing protein [Candidatus Polarisedimenticolaceae bacterium]